MEQKQYLKMANVITGDVVHICKDLFDGDGNLLDSVGLAYAAHAINSHDELVAENERLREALECATSNFPDAAKIVQNGWQLVPVEPTSAMLIAAGIATPRYKAMLAAAPKHEGGAS